MSWMQSTRSSSRTKMRSAVRGPRPERCRKCDTSWPSDTDYRWTKYGTPHTACRHCEDTERRRRSAERKKAREKQRESRASWSVWDRTWRESD